MLDFENIGYLELGGKQVSSLYLNGKLIWPSNFNVKFYNDDLGKEILSEQTVAYGHSAIEPEEKPYKSERWKFYDWNTDKWKCVTENLTVLPDFRQLLQVQYKYNEKQTFEQICSYISGSYVDYISKSYFDRPKYTICADYGLSPDVDFRYVGISSDQIVTIYSISNTISATYTTSIKKDQNPHALTTTISFNPDRIGDYIIKFKGEGTEWQSTPPYYTEQGDYPISVYASAENYFDLNDVVVFQITQADVVNVDFVSKKYNSGNDAEEVVHTIKQVEYNTKPTAPEIEKFTKYSDFTQWEDKINDVVVEPTTISAFYTKHYYSVKFFNDYLDGYSFKDQKTAEYNGEVALPASIARTGWEWQGWSLSKDRYSFIQAGASCKNVKNDLSAYACLLQIFNAKVSAIYGEESIEICNKSKVDHEYLSSNEFELPEVEGWEFSRYSPSMSDPKNNRWFITSDIQISAIYGHGSGNLTYHTNYPGTTTQQKTCQQQYQQLETFQLSSISADLHWDDLSQTEISDYEFAYWTSSAVDAVPYFFEKQNLALIDKQYDLYAQWEDNWFTLTYMTNRNN